MSFIPPPLCECPSTATEQVGDLSPTGCTCSGFDSWKAKQQQEQREGLASLCLLVCAQVDRQDGRGSCSEGTALPGIVARGVSGSRSMGCGQCAPMTC